MPVTQEVMATETIDHGIDPGSDTAFDPRRYFEQWWQDLEVSRAAPVAEETESDDSLRMLIESLPGSNCEVTFEGVYSISTGTRWGTSAQRGRVNCYEKRPSRS